EQQDDDQHDHDCADDDECLHRALGGGVAGGEVIGAGGVRRIGHRGRPLPRGEPTLRDRLSLSNHGVWEATGVGSAMVPKLWKDTIEEHRRSVRDATLDTTAALVAEHGLASVTMS